MLWKKTERITLIKGAKSFDDRNNDYFIYTQFCLEVVPPSRTKAHICTLFLTARVTFHILSIESYLSLSCDSGEGMA